ncbi:MAG: hypothetical protein ACP5MY_01140 [Methanobrevibacter sp.]
MTDEELDAIRNNSKPEDQPKAGKNKEKNQKEEDIEEEDETIEDDEIDEEPVNKKETKKDKKDKSTKEEDNNSEEDDDEDEPAFDEKNVVTGFFEVLSEKLGWSIDEDDEVPQTAEDLVKYFQDIIEEESKPSYANDEVARLDEYVKNGGDIKTYLKIDAELNLDEIEIEDDETNQKLVVKEFLKEKGFNEKSIEKKLQKYADAGLLEDEAEDALEALKEIKEQKKEQLLADQKKQSEEQGKRQQEFFNTVVSEIKGLDNIRGIKIPEKDKKTLMDYMFKPDSDGITKYQKDYAKNPKNLIESAYFTMKGDALINIAKKEGNKTAFDKFKSNLKSSNVSKKSNKEIRSDSDNIWSKLAQQLRA